MYTYDSLIASNFGDIWVLVTLNLAEMILGKKIKKNMNILSKVPQNKVNN